MSDLFLNRGALKYLTYLFQSPGEGLLVENTIPPGQTQVSQGPAAKGDFSLEGQGGYFFFFFPGSLQTGSAFPSRPL